MYNVYIYILYYIYKQVLQFIILMLFPSHFLILSHHDHSDIMSHHMPSLLFDRVVVGKDTATAVTAGTIYLRKSFNLPFIFLKKFFDIVVTFLSHLKKIIVIIKNMLAELNIMSHKDLKPFISEMHITKDSSA